MKIIDRKNIKSDKGKEFIGKVVSIKMTKTVVVEITQISRHKLYNKPVKRSKRLLAHCENINLALKDTVKIREVRPISKNVHFMIIEKVKI